MFSPQLPPRSAGPDQVRIYLTALLITKHDDTPASAAETANLWVAGRGSELRDISAQRFGEIFGRPIGWMLFRMVREDELADWEHSGVGIWSFYALVASLALAVFLALRALVLYRYESLPTERWKKASLMMSHAVFAVGISLINYGLLTPSTNGLAIALLGMMVAFPTMCVLVISLLRHRKVFDYVPVAKPQ